MLAGDACWQALETEAFLRRNEVSVLEAAQRVGNLPFVLCEIAAGIERRQRYRLLYCLEALKPVIVLAVGLTVAFICIAFFMPLIELIKQQGVP